jgi:hypothetical protein
MGWDVHRMGGEAMFYFQTTWFCQLHLSTDVNNSAQLQAKRHLHSFYDNSLY